MLSNPQFTISCSVVPSPPSRAFREPELKWLRGEGVGWVGFWIDSSPRICISSSLPPQTSNHCPWVHNNSPPAAAECTSLFNRWRCGVHESSLVLGNWRQTAQPYACCCGESRVSSLSTLFIPPAWEGGWGGIGWFSSLQFPSWAREPCSGILPSSISTSLFVASTLAVLHRDFCLRIPKHSRVAAKQWESSGLSCCLIFWCLRA